MGRGFDDFDRVLAGISPLNDHSCFKCSVNAYPVARGLYEMSCFLVMTQRVGNISGGFIYDFKPIAGDQMV